MTERTNGAEFKAYYNDKNAWPEGWWHEEAIITIDGTDYNGMVDVHLDAVDDNSILTITDGCIYQDELNPLPISMETHFARWRKDQTVERVVVEVDKARKDEFLSSIKQFDAKVVK